MYEEILQLYVFKSIGIIFLYVNGLASLFLLKRQFDKSFDHKQVHYKKTMINEISIKFYEGSHI